MCFHERAEEAIDWEELDAEEEMIEAETEESELLADGGE
jgi:hypothetical protein